jgi:hypothetical protein
VSKLLDLPAKICLTSTGFTGKFRRSALNGWTLTFTADANHPISFLLLVLLIVLITLKGSDWDSIIVAIVCKYFSS